LLGGDITVWGDDLIKFVKEMKETNIPYGFTTNMVLLTEEHLKNLKENGLDSISVSLDTLKNRKDGSENHKSWRAISSLPLLNELGFKELHCTIAVDKTNLEELPKIVEFLTRNKTYSEITPMLFGKSEAYDYTSSYEDLKDRLFISQDKQRIDKVMEEIVRMKKYG
jgi:MoaA/NifB/PqqE/SkfB family radical SAM enzyme